MSSLLSNVYGNVAILYSNENLSILMILREVKIIINSVAYQK